MRNWSIFSDNVRYIQHEQKTPHKLNTDTLDYRYYKELYFKLKGEERETLDVDFGIYPDLLKSKYLDVYKGANAEMVYANKFNENSNLSTTYLGQTQETYWTAQNVKSCWTQVPQNLTCQNLTICNAKLYMHYLNSLLTCKEFK